MQDINVNRSNFQNYDGALAHLHDLLSSLQIHLLAYCVNEADTYPSESYVARVDLLQKHLDQLLLRACTLYYRAANIAKNSSNNFGSLCGK